MVDNVVDITERLHVEALCGQLRDLAAKVERYTAKARAIAEDPTRTFEQRRTAQILAPKGEAILNEGLDRLEAVLEAPEETPG